MRPRSYVRPGTTTASDMSSRRTKRAPNTVGWAVRYEHWCEFFGKMSTIFHSFYSPTQGYGFGCTVAPVGVVGDRLVDLCANNFISF